MTLREVTRTVIKRVEDASGCPVVVSEDTSLKTLAAARIARVFRSCLRTNVDSRVGSKNRLSQPARDIASQKGDSRCSPSLTVWVSPDVIL